MNDFISPVYVLGHVNPDTDSIASAIGYAWLLKERDNLNAIAVRLGPLNPQTSSVLRETGLEAPVLLPDASPRFERITRHFPPILPDHPLREAWSAASKSRMGVPIVNEDSMPMGILTGNSVFQFISRHLETMHDFENISIARLLSVPCRDAMDPEVPRFLRSMRVRDGRRRVIKEERDDFIVTNDDGTYYGVCRSPDVLNPPRLQIVLVDHNESSQSIRALDEADIVEVVDHHRIGTLSTKMPIPFTIVTVGSTSTIVSERILDARLHPPMSITLLLLAGVLSDTLLLSSPTTTPRDHEIAKRLMNLAQDSGYDRFLTYQDFGRALMSWGSGLATQSIGTIISNDLKIYDQSGLKFGIAQVEVGSLVELDGRVSEISQALELLCTSRGLALAIMMVTDPVRSTSRLIISGSPELLNDLPYTRLPDNAFDAPGLVSRKKQLLPMVFGLLEG